MKITIIKKVILTLVLMLVAGGYLSMVYPYRFYYQEQYQLFLMNAQYAREVMSVPGGVADYIGRYLTQFAYLKYGGPVVWAVCIGLFQALVVANMRNRNTVFYYLSLIPTTFLWIYLQNANALLGTGVAFILALAVAGIVNKVDKSLVHGVLALLLIPVLYGAIGPVVWLFTALCIVRQITGFRQYRWLFSALMIGVNISVPILNSQFIYLPLASLTSGIHYYRIPDSHPFLIWFILGMTVLVVAIPELTIRREKIRRLARWSVPAICMLVSAWFVFTQTKPAQDEPITYLYWGRNRQWDTILQHANRATTRSVPGVCYTNLALGMEGKMATHLFDYFQTGGGLIPIMQTDYLVSVVSGDIYYQLGMTYLAQQQYMEAMECAPDMQKSAYLYQKLAETNLINGSYTVAYKYLKALQQTLFYRDWATQTLSLLGDEKAIKQHPEYGRLRSANFSENQYARGTILDFLQAQCEQHPDNRLAFDYLMVCAMLVKDVEHLPAYYELGKQHYKAMPALYQQALAVLPQDSITANPSWAIDSKVTDGYQEFLHSFMNGYTAEQMLSRWGSTYWFYFHYAK